TWSTQQHERNEALIYLGNPDLSVNPALIGPYRVTVGLTSSLRSTTKRRLVRACWPVSQSRRVSLQVTCEFFLTSNRPLEPTRLRRATQPKGRRAADQRIRSIT